MIRGEVGLSGLRVVVTGGARGIGRAIVERAARAGAKVDFCFRSSREEAASLVALLSAEGADVVAREVDVRSTSALEAWLTEIEGRRAGIDALVNNAGVTLERLLLATSDDELTDLLAVDLVAPMVASRVVLRGMVRRRTGVILHLGSSAARSPVRGQSVYAAAKGALEAFTRALAVEVGSRNVRVLCVAPGPVRTSMITSALALDEATVRAHGRDGEITEPDEIARLVTFLLSEKAAKFTGCTFSTGDDVPGFTSP